MTRPRKPSPTGTERTSPVRRTGWPSSMPANSPRTTTPISLTSRFSARPSVPSSNSSSSFAIAEGSPSTRAIPSPAIATRPTSSRAAAAGSYDFTKASRASRISSGRIVSSVMVAPCSLLSDTGSATGQPALDVGQAGADGSVDHVVADLDLDAADQVGLDDHVELDRTAGLRGQRLLEPFTVLGAQRRRHPDQRHSPGAPASGQLANPVECRLQGAVAPGQDDVFDQPDGLGCGLVGQQSAHQFAPGRCGCCPVQQGRTQCGGALDDLAEPEQLVLHAVKTVSGFGRREVGDDAELLDGRHQVAGTRPSLPDGGGGQLGGSRVEPVTYQRLGQRGSVVRAATGVGERTAYGGLLAEHPGEGEQGVADRGCRSAVLADGGVDPFAERRIGLLARPLHQASWSACRLGPTPSPLASSSARNRSTTRCERASSSKDSPTTRSASWVAMVPTSARNERTTCSRSAAICACARSAMRSASACADSRISARIAAPWALASSRIRAASARASASWARYCSSAR